MEVDIPIAGLIARSILDNLSHPGKSLEEWLKVSKEKHALCKQVMDRNWVACELDKMYQSDESAGWKKMLERCKKIGACKGM